LHEDSGNIQRRCKIKLISILNVMGVKITNRIVWTAKRLSKHNHYILIYKTKGIWMPKITELITIEL